VSLDGMTVKGKIASLKPTIEVSDTAVGQISGELLTKIFDTAAEMFIVPQLNIFGEKGFQLPVVKHVNFIRPNITFDAHALCVTTDVEYSA